MKFGGRVQFGSSHLYIPYFGYNYIGIGWHTIIPHTCTSTLPVYLPKVSLCKNTSPCCIVGFEFKPKGKFKMLMFMPCDVTSVVGGSVL